MMVHPSPNVRLAIDLILIANRGSEDLALLINRPNIARRDRRPCDDSTDPRPSRKTILKIDHVGREADSRNVKRRNEQIPDTCQHHPILERIVAVTPFARRSRLTARISCVADEPRPRRPKARSRTEAARSRAPSSHVSCMRSLARCFTGGTDTQSDSRHRRSDRRRPPQLCQRATAQARQPRTRFP